MQVDESSLLRLLADEKTQHQGFAVLVKTYSEMLYRQIRRMVLNHEDANDILQNTFIKAWQGLSSFEGRSHISSWLYRIAINETYDFMRKHRDEASLSSDNGEGANIISTLLADEFFDGDETEAQLQQIIQQLPYVQRTVFQLRYFENKRYSEISEILGTSEGALKASYHIAVQKITDFFKSKD